MSTHYTINKTLLGWEITRPATAEELERYGVSPEDPMPMSALGISVEGAAIVMDEEIIRRIQAGQEPDGRTEIHDLAVKVAEFTQSHRPPKEESPEWFEFTQMLDRLSTAVRAEQQRR